jgi:hypothetical protein
VIGRSWIVELRLEVRDWNNATRDFNRDWGLGVGRLALGIQRIGKNTHPLTKPINANHLTFQRLTA